MGAFYWQMISDALKSDGFSVDWMRIPGDRGRTIWQARASRGDERWMVSADDLSVALLELENATREPKAACAK